MIKLIMAVLGGAYGVYKYYNDNKYEYDSTIIIGPQSSGKTHLANWLNENKLLDEYTPTTNKVKVGEFLDIRGGEIQAKDWENLIKNQKNIFYLFDMKKYLTKEEYAKSKYNEIVINHISFFTEYLERKGSMLKKKLIIIGTHLDKIKDSEMQDIIDTLQGDIDLNDSKIICGSLLDEERAKKLENEIIKILKEDKR
jgi:flavodoxin